MVLSYKIWSGAAIEGDRRHTPAGATLAHRSVPLQEAQRAEPHPAKWKQRRRDAVNRINEMAYAIDLFDTPSGEAWQPWRKNDAPNVDTNGMPLENAWPGC